MKAIALNLSQSTNPSNRKSRFIRHGVIYYVEMAKELFTSLSLVPNR